MCYESLAVRREREAVGYDWADGTEREMEVVKRQPGYTTAVMEVSDVGKDR